MINDEIIMKARRVLARESKMYKIFSEINEFKYFDLQDAMYNYDHDCASQEDEKLIESLAARYF